MKNLIKKQINGKLAIAIISLAAFSAVILIIIGLSIPFPNFSSFFPGGSIPSATDSKIGKMEKFSGEDDFKEYLQKTKGESDYFGFSSIRTGGMENIDVMTMEMSKGTAMPDRVSETNVQVAGIDEPDIVKTNGQEIYFSSMGNYYPRQFERTLEIMPRISGELKIIKAFPPAELSLAANIEKSGNLLLNNNILMIFSSRQIFGYDVSDPKNPREKWDIKLENNNFIVEARLYKDKVYLIAKSMINESRPCPIEPLKVGEKSLVIECGEIYHSVLPTPTDVVFTAMIFDPVSGEIKKNISFTGSSGSSVIYMSEKAIYATYPYYGSMIEFFSGFLKDNQDIFPNWVIEKIEKLESYNISSQAKLLELQINLEKYQDSLTGDEKLKIENEMLNRIQDYYKKHKRELEKTGIIKIGLDKFKVAASGDIPGSLLNQFSLDEYNGYLRAATTIGQRWGSALRMGIGRQESSNDVYVLDKDLKITGSVKDLGLTERIYSARFIKDKGYIVTFRQTDPFYVLDLSNPQKPEMKGELKIPGYSSYLHPITKDRILGTGKEGWKVKISLFDVSDPKNPTEKDKYILDESWSDVLSTHHAFLLDKRHSVFFMPGNKGGYVFSYKGDKLKLVKAVSGIRAKRAIYINDYLYIIGENKISVLNELDWEKVNELEFKN